jgi:hypothetical protein
MDDTEETLIWDFGFNAMSEDDVKKAEKEALNKKTDQLTDVQRKLIGIKKMLWPLFEHLRQDPLKPYLYWPTRAEKVTDLMNKLQKYMEE